MAKQLKKKQAKKKHPMKNASARHPKRARGKRLSAKPAGVKQKGGTFPKNLPGTENAVVLRTDFSDDAAWESVCAAIQAPVGVYRAYVDCVSARNFEGLTAEQVPSLAPK